MAGGPWGQTTGESQTDRGSEPYARYSEIIIMFFSFIFYPLFNISILNHQLVCCSLVR